MTQETELILLETADLLLRQAKTPHVAQQVYLEKQLMEEYMRNERDEKVFAKLATINRLLRDEMKSFE